MFSVWYLPFDAEINYPMASDPGASLDWRSIEADGALFHAGRFASKDGGEATSNQARCLNQTGEQICGLHQLYGFNGA